MTAALALLLAAAVAQSPPEGPPADAADRFAGEMAEYVLRDDAGELTFRKEPVLHWNNPARYGENGALFVWTRDGRPEAIGTAFTFRVGQTIGHAHEFVSLSSGPVTAAKGDATAWSPRGPGLTFAPLADAPRPAASEPARLVQMRSFARNYEIDFLKDDGSVTRLRLVPQPLLRYAAPRRGVADGAVFSFAISTDPEALLVLEARGDGADARWHYAFARLHFQELRASRGDEVVWEAERKPELLKTKFGDADALGGSYTIFRFPYERLREPTQEPPPDAAAAPPANRPE